MVSKEQVLTFKKSADQIYILKDYTSSTILYFKTLFAIKDFFLLEKLGYAPKDHTERFAILKIKFPDEYRILDSEFNTFDINSITINELKGDGFIAKEGLYLEGKSLISGKLLSESLGFISLAF